MKNKKLTQKEVIAELRGQCRALESWNNALTMQLDRAASELRRVDGQLTQAQARLADTLRVLTGPATTLAPASGQLSNALHEAAKGAL